MEKVDSGMHASPSFFGKVRRSYNRYMDSFVPHRRARWAVTAFLLLMYVCRIYTVGGFPLVTYFMSIRLLFLAVSLITPSQPIVAELPTTDKDDECRPFVPVNDEFVVWRSSTATIVAAFVASCIPIFRIPAYWPILFLYVMILTISTIGGEVMKMVRYGYVPWTSGKKKFIRRAPATEAFL